MPLSGTNCHCLSLSATVCLIWDVEEIRSLGLPDHQQKVTILVVSTMLAQRWIEENVAKYLESKTPTAESIYAIDYSRRLVLFETACKVFAIPMEPLKVISLVSSDVNVLVIHGNEGSNEEISKGISTVQGRDRTGGLQETSADPSKCDHDGVEKSW